MTLREKLYRLSDTFAHKAYKVTKELPKFEVFGLGSQLRRASVSVPCNIIEGFARDGVDRTKKELVRFLEFAHGSLEESKYLITFSSEEYPMDKRKVKDALNAADHIGGLLFGFIKKLRKEFG
jgi:four helix bundle protein